MFVRRTAELKLLQEQYATPESNLIILYGRKGIGKTTLLTEFLENKPSVYYYEGMEGEGKLQLEFMNRQLKEAVPNAEAQEDYPQLFSKFLSVQDGKAIIVLDEFHYIRKNSPEIIQTLKLLENSKQPVMFVLCSSSVRWVENDMLEDLGASSALITTYMKLKEFTFVDFVNRFPKSTVEACIYIKSILGGVPGYLEEWQESKTVRENIITIMLNKNSRLFEETQHFLKLELREPAVYNTILYALATGNRKLNDLHGKTGFSRAKISVYLKHLIQLDLVEKLVPTHEEGKENALIGLYRIKDNFMSFWYRFVYPNRPELMLGKAEEVYDKVVAPKLSDYMREYYADVCAEYLKLMNLHDRLPVKYLYWDTWYGKNGTIDILAQGERNEILVGNCLWEERPSELSDYERLVALAKEAGVTPKYYYLFSKKGFTEELGKEAAKKGELVLIGLEDL